LCKHHAYNNDTDPTKKKFWRIKENQSS